MRNWLLGAFASALMSSVVNAAVSDGRAQFPLRPVRLIVPYAPGGATDLTARQLATKLNEIWGQGVVVDNRAGASGNIALDTAARSCARVGSDSPCAASRRRVRQAAAPQGRQQPVRAYDVDSCASSSCLIQP